MSMCVSSFGAPFRDPLHARFEALLPRIERHARIYFRDLRCSDTREDAIQETLSLAWKWFRRLAEKGKDAAAFPMAFAALAAKAVRWGRRICGQLKAGDALNPHTQRRHGFKVSSLPSSTATSHETLLADPIGQRKLDEWEQYLAPDSQTPIPDQVQFKLDFRDWMRTLTPRERRIIRMLAKGERTRDVSKAFDLSDGRISQLRGEFRAGWRHFMGDETLCYRAAPKQRKRKVRR